MPQTCASEECTRAYNLWRRIVDRTPDLLFRGARLCFPDCFERELLRHLELLSSSTATSAVLRPSRRIPVGLLMLSRGTITNEQLRRALDEQRQTGTGRIGEWLNRLGFVRERDITAALAMQWSCPQIRKLPPMTHKFGVPVYLLQKFRMAPVYFSRARATLYIAFANEIAYSVLVSIEQMLQVKTQVCLTTEPELEAALACAEEMKLPGEKLFENSRGLGEMVRVISGYAEKFRGSEVRLTVCGDYFWARILAAADAVDLIFSRKACAHRSGLAELSHWVNQ
ncbi:MAG TPA: hypothetical protein VJO35_02470 [Terriglobales bacterium]|nr:hypothetical protein [Terriglobales bacterium]